MLRTKQQRGEPSGCSGGRGYADRRQGRALLSNAAHWLPPPHRASVPSAAPGADRPRRDGRTALPACLPPRYHRSTRGWPEHSVAVQAGRRLSLECKRQTAAAHPRAMPSGMKLVGSEALAPLDPSAIVANGRALTAGRAIRTAFKSLVLPFYAGNLAAARVVSAGGPIATDDMAGRRVLGADDASPRAGRRGSLVQRFRAGGVLRTRARCRAAAPTRIWRACRTGIGPWSRPASITTPATSHTKPATRRRPMTTAGPSAPSSLMSSAHRPPRPTDRR